ncbi:MAG: DUF4982 domain-containing protein [Flavobacteriaceae bacterium]|nr:DUF4982 domain-containing protein [Flavobacteriaceae bacterium]
MNFQILATYSIFLIISYSTLAQTREIFTLSQDWKFTKGNPNDASQINFDDTSWQTVKIPHDWAINEPFILDGDGSTGKLPWKAEGWYRKKLDLKNSFKDKRVILLFDGIMAFPKIYINGKLAGQWDYGYNSFFVDVTDFLNFNGENILAVYANTLQHDSRWYPGGGIYRKVQMIITDPVHVDIWGTYITTPIIKEHSTDVRISSTILNQFKSDEKVKVEQIILNDKGEEVARDSITKTILTEKEKKLEVTLQISNPKMWDIDNPVLYSVLTNVFIGDELTDSEITKFGIRTIKFKADDGFYLNGRRVQLKGVNLHSDLGPLGMAFNKRAMQRELNIMKSMGVNAIRNSHNVAAPELLELCDEMGLLLFDEAFDKYDAKIDINDATDFEDFAQRNIKNFIIRDRNHPSVFIWSVGNEIGDVQNNIDNGFQRLHTMINYVNKYDPTRPVTLVNDNMQSAALRHFDYYDVHSWNYGRRYRLARELEPNKSVIISESASTVSTRGFYEFPLPEKKTDFTNSLQVSSYDLNAPEWAEISDDDFMWQQDEPYVAGEFVWTGFDYLGEPTPYSNQEIKKTRMSDKEASRSSYFGIVDLVGIPKDRYYLYKSYWKPNDNMVHILPHWNWKGKESEIVPVFAYTNGDCGELFVNGKSYDKQCKKPSSKNSVERFRLMWKNVIYQPGSLKVVAYKNGESIAEETIKTADKPNVLKLTPDKTILKANGEDLSYILVEAYDKNGVLCPLADNKIEISIEGPAEIAGVGNGNPQSFVPFKSNNVNLFYGKAMIIIKSQYQRDTIKIKVSSKSLKSDSIRLKID